MSEPRTLAARELVASRYPETITDSQDREHPCIPRKAILSGAWDQGELVRAAMKEVGDGQRTDQ